MSSDEWPNNKHKHIGDHPPSLTSTEKNLIGSFNKYKSHKCHE